MRHLVAAEPGRAEWAQTAAPVLGTATSAIVRPIALATCDFDHLIVAGRAPVPFPVALGHEFVAEVQSVGSDVSTVAEGDQVVVSFQISCGTCDRCVRGLTSSCERVPWLSCYGLGPGSGDHGGATADLVLVPYADAMLVLLPATVSPEDAAAAGCNIVDAYRCVAPQLEQLPGADVLVVGGAFAAISHYAIGIATALGAGRVGYFSPDPDQAALAERLGAHVYGAPGEVPLEAFPITVDASQDPDLLALAVRATSPGGELTASTMYSRSTTPVPLIDMFARCLTFRTGQPHARALLDPVLDLIGSGRLRPSDVTESVVGWDDAPEVFSSGSGKHICRVHG